VDLRWVAYVGSGLIAAVSLVPVTVSHAPPSSAMPASAGEGARAPSAGPDPVLLDIQRNAARLREYARAAPPPRTPARNPFAYAVPRRLASSAPRPGPAPLADEPAPALASPPPSPLALVGMAERSTPGGPVRTAILSGLDDVHLVVVGDRIGGRFLVTAIGADAVELLDETTGSAVRLALR
jgi:hypothetical protein